MNPRSPSSSTGGYPSKRARHSPSLKSPASSTSYINDPLSAVDPSPPGELPPDIGGGKAGQSSSFRNVSACNRCRLRKNRCDQKLPSCASCEKAGVKCVGYDPITKREIPRSYVFYLETRVSYLENLLQSNNIPFTPAETLDLGSRPSIDPNAETPTEEVPPSNGNGVTGSALQKVSSRQEENRNKEQQQSANINKLVSNIGMVSTQGTSDPRYLGATSGISFARVVFAAVKSSVSGTNSDRGSNNGRSLSAKTGPTGTSMRDSFFGLQTKPTIRQAPFPDKDIGLRLANLYFEHANPQVPILHRGEFMKMFEQAYAGKDRQRSARELYMLNIVFAIGAGIILGSDSESDVDSPGYKKHAKSSGSKRIRSSSQQCQPEEYHASAIVHLEACLSATAMSERPDGFGGGLEELQAVLLLAGFALLRPVAPGLWYITGVAVRLAIDLGLHYEDGKDLEVGLEDDGGDLSGEMTEQDRIRRENNNKERGRRAWVRDFRRRLWWCTYSFDRLVSTCVGRPFGITDQVITTEFPTLLEDKYITPEGFLDPPGGPSEPSSKHVAYHYFRLRLLQSEILQVLQFQQAQLVRAGGTNQRNPYMHTQLPSPFLSKFDSFRSWRIDIDRRLWQWKESAPTKKETGVLFSPEFLELNYWQAVIMLYRQSLSVPPGFEGEYSTSNEVESPSAHTVELREDEERVFLKVAEAGQRVLRLYRQLHRVHLVNYTFLATHHLFMAGISFLYAIWHSPIVRSRLTMDEVDFTILAATSVLGDLIEKCPPAEACRDAFDRMSKATVQMCLSTTGFGSSAQGLSSRSHHKHSRGDNESTSSEYFGPAAASTQFATSNARNRRRSSHRQHSAEQLPPVSGYRTKPHFDMGLNDLFPSHTAPQSQAPSQPQSQNQTPYQTSPISNSGRPLIKNEYVKAEYANDAYGIPRNAVHSPSDYAISPPGGLSTQQDQQPNTNSAIDPSLLPSPHARQAALHQQQNPQQYLPPDPNNIMYNNGYGDMDFSLQNMDFLQGGPGGLGGVHGDGNGQGGGLDLGFGLGWEGMDHDFSEGNQVDLFDGFFFGGQGGGLGGGGGGGGGTY